MIIPYLCRFLRLSDSQTFLERKLHFWLWALLWPVTNKQLLLYNIV
jgi:hypothetical protein